MKELEQKLQAPFPPEDIEWRAQSSGYDKSGQPWALIMPYVTNRAIQERLDDVFGWVVILFGSIAIQLWDNYLLDPIMTLGFTAFTFWGVTKNLKETFNILLQGVPQNIDIEAIKKELITIEEIEGVHDVHIWSLEGETNIFTGHIVVKDSPIEDSCEIRKKIKELLKKHHIKHSTLEIETPESCSGVEDEKR